MYQHNLKLPVKDSSRTSPHIGEKGYIYFDDSTSTLKVSNGHSWVSIGNSETSSSAGSRDVSSSVVASSVLALKVLTIPAIRVSGTPLQTVGSLAYDTTSKTVYYASPSSWLPLGGINSITAGNNTIVIGGTATDPTIRAHYTAGTGISIVGNMIINTDPGAFYTAGTGITIIGTTISNVGVTSLIAGSGIGVSSVTGDITITNLSPGITYTAGTGISIVGNVITNTNPGAVYTAGTGITIIGTTISNAGVTSLIAGSGIGVSSATGDITITNLSPGITYTAGSGISIVGTTISNTGVIAISAADSTISIGGTASNPSIAGNYTASTGISIIGNAIGNTGVTSFQTSLSGLTPSVATTGSVTLAGTLNRANGGTGLTGPFTNGQLLIGNGTGFTANLLQAGSGITITNGAGTISIASSVGGVSSVTASLDMTVSPTTGNVIVTSTQRKSITYYSRYFQSFGTATGAGSNADFYAVVTSQSYSPTGLSNLFTGYSTNTGGIPSNAPDIMTSTNPLSTDNQGWHCNVSGLYLVSYTLAISNTDVNNPHGFWACVFEFGPAVPGWAQVPGTLTQACLAPDSSSVSNGGSQGLMSTNVLFQAVSGNSYNLCIAGYDPVFFPAPARIFLGSQTQMGPGPTYGPPTGFAGGGIISTPTTNTTASITFTYIQATN